MSPREIFTLVLRILSLWHLITGFGVLVSFGVEVVAVRLAQSRLIPVESFGFLNVSVRLGLMVAVFLAAPRIAQLLYRGEADRSAVMTDAYRIALQLLGLYALLLAVSYATNVLSLILNEFPFDLDAWSDMLRTIAYVGFGLYLTLGSKGVARWLNHLRHWPFSKEGTPRCVQCGYDLRGSIEPRCPECGTPVAPFQRAETAGED